MKKILSTIILICILMIAGETNPPKDKYIAWLKEQIKSEADNSLVNFGVEVFGGSIINAATESQNYVFFSIFDTKIAGNEVKVLGIFNNYVLLKKSTNSSSESSNGS